MVVPEECVCDALFLPRMTCMAMERFQEMCVVTEVVAVKLFRDVGSRRVEEGLMGFGG
jgi:hypothetical protein